MVETSIIVERVSKALSIPPEELVRRGVEEFLEAQLRACLAEIREVEARYGVKSVDELEEKIRGGVIEERPGWEDLIVLENLEERAERIRKELKALKS